MAGNRSGRSASRKSTPISPPKQNTIEAPTDVRRSTRRQPEDDANSNDVGVRGLGVESNVSIASRTRRTRKGAAAPLPSKLTALQTMDRYPNLSF